MSNNNLKKFIKQQAIKGEDPEKIRSSLILNGWNVKEIDKTIKEVYGFKKKLIKTTMILLILLIFLFTIILLTTFNKNWDKTPKEKEIQEEPTPENCELIQDNIKKETCYKEKIKQGYDCENLTKEEQYFCNKALERYILDLYEI